MVCHPQFLYLFSSNLTDKQPQFLLSQTVPKDARMEMGYAIMQRVYVMKDGLTTTVLYPLQTS